MQRYKRKRFVKELDSAKDKENKRQFPLPNANAKALRIYLPDS